MATSKKPTPEAAAKNSGDTGTRAEKASAAKSDTDPTYASKAADLAETVRATADNIREQANGLIEQVNDLQQNNEPTATEVPVADGVRRIPMAVDDVARAVDSLTEAAAELTRRATS